MINRRPNPRAIAARNRRLQRSGRIELPVQPVASCVGCLRELFARPLYVVGEAWCSSECFVRGRHWVDPRACGGCHGAHPIGVRP